MSIRAQKIRDRSDVFYEFPAKHWPHIRTTNSIESAFATARLRTKKSQTVIQEKQHWESAEKKMKKT